MSQDQRPPRVRLTRVTETAAARPAPNKPSRNDAPAAERKQPRGIAWSTILLFIIACLIGGMLSALIDLPGYLLV